MFPLLKQAMTFWNFPDLSHVAIVGAQHLLGCTTELVKSFLELGISPNNVYLIGKCYSTSSEAVNDLRSLNVYVSSLSKKFSSDKSFDELYHVNLCSFVSKIVPQCVQKNVSTLIVLDDGGGLIEEIEKQLDRLPKIKVMGVEQTSSGYNKLCKNGLKFPVINIARSKTKLTYESPFIVRNCLRAIEPHLGAKPIEGYSTLILGDGPIGRSFFNLIDSENIRIIDTQKVSSSAFRLLLQEAELIIGCTGGTSVGSSFHSSLRDNAILVSASSSDREFAAVALRETFPVSSTCHVHYRCARGIYLLNSGFPVNFTGQKFVSSPKDIQLTLALLMGGVLQCISHPTLIRNWIPLDSNFQNAMINHYLDSTKLADSIQTENANLLN